MAKQNKGKVYYSMQAISILPLLLFGLIIIFCSTYFFTRAMHKEVATEMEISAELCKSLLDSVYPGDYQLKEDTIGDKTAYSLYKGDTDITAEYALVDKIKEQTDMDVTIFYMDTRILTTLRNWDGLRLVGTGAPDAVIAEVLETGTPQFYDKVIINHAPYFAYYTPLTNHDNSVVGMLFIGKPTESVNQMVQSSVLPIILIGAVSLIITALFSFYYAKQIVSTLHSLKSFFAKVSGGNLDATPEASILKREDEFSEIGQAALTMQRSLKTLIERDALTDLYNRRSCDKMLRQTINKSRIQETSFCTVLADIDHFKSINDTYGHESGDIVLQNVAKLLKTHMHKQGYVGRWGGEEFLMVYENCTIEQAKEKLTSLQTILRETLHKFENGETYVTLTYGLVCDSSLEPHELIKKADENLYMGKANGRDCIVS